MKPVRWPCRVDGTSVAVRGGIDLYSGQQVHTVSKETRAYQQHLAASQLDSVLVRLSAYKRIALDSTSLSRIISLTYDSR